MIDNETIRKLWIEDAERRVIDGAIDKIKFDQLYRSTWGICLNQPLVETASRSRFEGRQADPIVAKLGARGVRNALELAAGPRHFDVIPFPDKDYEPDPSFFYIGYDSLLRRPDTFGDGPDTEVLGQIEDFGNAMLGEAYKILGTDVGSKIDMLRNADSEEAQVEILLWLHERLKALKSREPFSNEDLQGFYHPARLSPKLGGQYPNHLFEPTCLGLSVIAASFVEQAALEHMHAGLMRTHHSEMMAAYRVALSTAVFDPDYEVPDYTKCEVQDRLNDLEECYRDVGFHAVSLVRLKSGRWFCLDPNFNQSYAFSQSKKTDRLSNAYDELQEFSTSGLSVEKTVWLPQASLPQIIGKIIAGTELSFDVSDFRTVLESDDCESLSRRISDSVLKSLSYSTDPERAFGELYDSIFESLRVEETGYPQKESELSIALRANISDYVLWDMNPSDFLHKCNNDPNFLDRRIVDVRVALYLAIADVAGYEIDRYSDNRARIDEYVASTGFTSSYHEVFECGLPAQRIGAAVLSDFDAYSSSGDQLSPSFWLAHWSSQVPVTETRGRLLKSVAQQRQLTKNMTALRVNLNYSHQNAIISEYLRPAQVDSGEE